jgi:hypothetical protein
VLRLTGPIPALPEKAMGTWFSWYHAYNQSAVESDMERWTTERLPIDIWGLDMDWRVIAGGEEGKCYCVNKELFPDMEGFMRFAHSRNLSLCVNRILPPPDPLKTTCAFVYSSFSVCVCICVFVFALFHTIFSRDHSLQQIHCTTHFLACYVGHSPMNIIVQLYLATKVESRPDNARVSAVSLCYFPMMHANLSNLTSTTGT